MDRFFIKQPMSRTNLIDEAEDVKHISKVLRLRKGDLIEVVDSLEKEYICEIMDIEKNRIHIKSIQEVNKKRELPIKLRVYQGIPKGQKMELIVQKLTEIGVSDIYPVNFKRCVSQMKEDKEEKKISRYQKIAYEAAKQSKRTVIPTIHPVLEVKDLPEALKSNSLNLLFYENEDKEGMKQFFDTHPIEGISSTGMLIGPEGGLTEDEVNMLKQEGCKVLTLGNRILRTETAGVVAAAIVAYEIETNHIEGEER